MTSRMAPTKISTEHIPSFCSGQLFSALDEYNGVSGTGASFTMMRICGSGRELQERTGVFVRIV